MPKNIVICCDGTANEFAADRTSVVKLYYTLEHDSPDQIAFYHPGLGTMEPPGALTTTSRNLTKLLGKMVGYGLVNDIRDAYVFLMNQFQAGDRVYLFGFSRGAYSARAVCSLLKMYGLIRPGNDALVPYAIRMMMGIQKAREADREKRATAEYLAAVENYFTLANEFRTTMARTACKPHFVGVWDTVSSVGWKDNPLKLAFISDNPDIAIGRHAISLDERRAFFRTHRWVRSKELDEHGPRDLKQVWFAGVHSDVGGGYPEAQSGLSKFALEWMLEEARTAGLLVNDVRQEEVLGRLPGSKFAKPDPACLHDSLTGFWKAAEWIRKPHYDWETQTTTMRRNRGRPRTIPSGALVHESVYARANGEYVKSKALPANAVRETTVRAARSGAADPHAPAL